MNSLEFQIDARVDGKSISGFPIIRRLEVDDIIEYSYGKANDGDTTTFSALPGAEVDSIKTLMVRSDKQITLRLDGQSDAGIVLNAGGLLVIVDCTIDAGAGAQNAKVNNNSGAAAIVEGLVAGT